MTDPGHADPSHAARLWTDRSFLRDVQYKTDVNLAARQSIYAYQEPPIDLPREILGLAGLSGHEVVADIGCGNGRYLAELARRGHAGLAAGRSGWFLPYHHPQRLPGLRLTPHLRPGLVAPG